MIEKIDIVKTTIGSTPFIILHVDEREKINEIIDVINKLTRIDHKFEESRQLEMNRNHSVPYGDTIQNDFPTLRGKNE